MAKQSVGAALREAQAMLTQARYLSKDLQKQHHEAEGPNVVLLHGLYASAGVFRPLIKELREKLNAATHSFSYLPGPGVVELSTRLASLINSQLVVILS